MTAIRVTRHIDSETIILPEIRGLIGRNVEIRIIDEDEAKTTNDDAKCVNAHPKITDLFDSKTQFNRLADEWYRATRLNSSIAAKSMHPAYQKIIGMGQNALPHIFARLQNGPGHWFWALTAITEAMPVPKDDFGDVEKMRSHWLAWGQQHGYMATSGR